MTDPSEAAGEYCRQIEAYLCRKNDGHLIRIVGPAFERVCMWADRGVPLTVAQRGIDRYFERYYAKGPRRRPVRIEFCEADVLDVFDQWRRVLGLDAGQTSGDQAPEGRDVQAGAASGPAEAPLRHGTLPAHLERVIARLTVLRAGEDRSLDATLDAVVRELDAARGSAKSLRGKAREQFLERLAAIDRDLLAAVRAQCDAATLAEFGRQADAELAPFRGRMAEEAFEAARRASVDRLIRGRARLPVVAFE